MYVSNSTGKEKLTSDTHEMQDLVEAYADKLKYGVSITDV